MRSRLISLGLCVLLLAGPMVHAGGYDASARAELLLSGATARDAQAMQASAAARGLQVSLSDVGSGFVLSVRAGSGWSLEAALSFLRDSARRAGLDGRAVVGGQGDQPVISQRAADVNLTHEKLTSHPQAAVLPLGGEAPAMGLLETVSRVPSACLGWHGQGSVCSLRGPPSSGGMITLLFA